MQKTFQYPLHRAVFAVTNYNLEGIDGEWMFAKAVAEMIVRDGASKNSRGSCGLNSGKDVDQYGYRDCIMYTVEVVYPYSNYFALLFHDAPWYFTYYPDYAEVITNIGGVKGLGLVLAKTPRNAK